MTPGIFEKYIQKTKEIMKVQFSEYKQQSLETKDELLKKKSDDIYTKYVLDHLSNIYKIAANYSTKEDEGYGEDWVFPSDVKQDEVKPKKDEESGVTRNLGLIDRGPEYKPGLETETTDQTIKEKYQERGKKIREEIPDMNVLPGENNFKSQVGLPGFVDEDPDTMNVGLVMDINNSNFVGCFEWEGRYHYASSKSLGVANFDVSSFLTEDAKIDIVANAYKIMEDKLAPYNFISKDSSSKSEGQSETDEIGFDFIRGINIVMKYSDIDTSLMKARLEELGVGK